MEPEPGASAPAMPELSLSAPAPAASVEAMSAVLEAFLARFEATSSQKGGNKHPLPVPASGDGSDTEPDPAAAGSGSVMSDVAGLAHSVSEDDFASGSALDKAFCWGSYHSGAGYTKT